MESPFRFRFHIRDLMFLTLVVAMLLGLMLPAVNAARESARRTACGNNLKQLGLGAHNYASTYKERLPYGTIQNVNLVPERRLSWVIAIYPFLEQIFYQLEFGESWDSGKNLPPMARIDDSGDRTKWKLVPSPSFPVLVCPSRALPDVRGLSATAYIGPAGMGEDAPFRLFGDARNGVWAYDRQTKLTDITDGLGQTILFLETSRGNGPWTAGGPPTVRPFLEEKKPLGDGRAFGGFHPQGCQAAFADGSVEFIKLDVDPQSFAEQFTIAEEASRIALAVK
jgi:prepilin-type processing-associated H-X9-DG protein